MENLLEKITRRTQSHPGQSTAIILSLLIIIFISPSFFQGRYLAPVDVFHFVAPYLDITTQMLPWYHLSAQLIGTGHLPFWNIFSGNGLPLMANMQSAVFFPLSWLFYIFNIRAALVLYSFIKFLLGGMFMYWYLKEIKLSYFASLLGAILFTFCGVNVIWFLWPLTSVILLLPLAFLLIEKYFNTGQIKFALLLAPVITLGLLAGHPQTFFYIFLAIYAYTLFKTFTTCSSIKQGLVKVALLSATYVLGVAMSAVQLLPFLEYLKLSANLDYRAGFTENPFFLAKSLFLANLIPDFYGNTGVKNFSYLLVPNYGELALGYIGITALILSLFAFSKKISKLTLFFGLSGLLCLALIYHAPIIYPIVNKLPGFSLNYNNRLLYLWAFFLVILAAMGLDKLLSKKPENKKFNLVWLGAAVFSGLMIIINKLGSRSWNFAHDLDWATVNLWQNVLIIAFFANLILSYFIIKNLPRKWALGCLLALIFLETGIHGMIFTKTSKPANFYPPEPAYQYLQNHYTEGYYRTFTYGHELLPNIGTWYGINELNDHDTIYLKSNKQIKKSVANFNYSPEYTFDEPNLNALRFLGVKYLLYPAGQGQNFLTSHANDVKEVYGDANYKILALTNPLPRAFIISASDTTDLALKMDTLIKNPNSGIAKSVTDFKLQTNGTEIVSYTVNKDSYLVTTDNYYPGWIANSGSNDSVEVYDVSGLRAVPITAGSDTLTISYRPKSFAYGLYISLAALGAWLILFFTLKNKKPSFNI